VHLEHASTVRGRLRSYEIAPTRFRQLAFAAAAMLLVIVATGATVRLTSSGLGCEHWPGCQPGQPFPEKGFHSYIEFSNRIVAFLTICATLAAWVGALLTPGLSRRTKLLALVTFLGTLGQAPLGAITVYFHLNPYLVLTHLLLSLAVLGVGVLVALDALLLEQGRAPFEVPAVVRWGVVLLLVACAALVTSGTFVTGSGPHPGGSDVRRLGAFSTAIWIHVRATAVFGLAFLLLLAWAWRTRERLPGALRAAVLLLALLLAQMAIGETQYRTALPWWLVLVHVTMAAAVWGWTVAVAVMLWRPPAALAKPPAQART
jgi:cytochrome c oxidase assembly protein subunit 15